MPHFKLFASGRRSPHLRNDEIIIGHDEETGDTHSLSLHEAREIPDELVDKARAIAGRVGLRVEEASAPDSEEEQEVGADVQGQAKPGEGASASGGADSPGTSTSGSSATSGTTAQTTGGSTPGNSIS